MSKSALVKTTMAAGLLILSSCTDADVAARSINTAANNFEIMRRVVLYNTRTDAYIIQVEGKCVIENIGKDKPFAIICKDSPTEYKRTVFTLSADVTAIVQQIEMDPANPYRYQVLYKPEFVFPSIRYK